MEIRTRSRPFSRVHPRRRMTHKSQSHHASEQLWEGAEMERFIHSFIHTFIKTEQAPEPEV